VKSPDDWYEAQQCRGVWSMRRRCEGQPVKLNGGEAEARLKCLEKKISDVKVRVCGAVLRAHREVLAAGFRVGPSGARIEHAEIPRERRSERDRDDRT